MHKKFWKQMYLSNQWAINKVVVPISVIAIFLTVGFLTSIIFGIPESIQKEELWYCLNLFGWYFLSGFSILGITVATCLFMYNVPYAAISKTLAIARYCKLPLSKEELAVAKNSNVFEDVNSYFTYIQKQLKYCRGKRSFSLTDEEIEESIRISIDVFNLKQGDIIHVNDKLYARIILKNTEKCDIECIDQFYKGKIIRRYFWAIRPDGSLYDPLKQ